MAHSRSAPTDIPVKILLAAQTASLVAMVCIVMAMVASNQIRNKDHLRPNHEEMLWTATDRTSAQDQRVGSIVAKTPQASQRKSDLAQDLAGSTDRSPDRELTCR